MQSYFFQQTPTRQIDRERDVRGEAAKLLQVATHCTGLLGIVLVYKYHHERYYPIGWLGQQVTRAYTLTPLLLTLLIAYS